MALVASGLSPSVWRDPNVMAISTLTPPILDDELRKAEAVGSSADDPVNVKDENGHDISCVVCGDKSSGKHYGQFTCEGITPFTLDGARLCPVSSVMIVDLHS